VPFFVRRFVNIAKNVLEVIENLKRSRYYTSHRASGKRHFLQDFEVEKNKKYALVFEEVHGVSQRACIM
jgi:hypothetical protein